MNRLRSLIKLNIKRAFQSLFSLVFGAIALICLVGAIAFCGSEYLYGSISDTQIAPLNLAVVLKDDSTLAQNISNGISSNSDIKKSIAFHFVDEDIAISGIEQGLYICAIVIEENTADSILNGYNIPIQIVFPQNSGMEAILIKEIADAAATLLSSAQAGIYSMYDIYNAYDADKYLDGALLRMNLKYISFVATGANHFNTTELSATGSTSVLMYYICCGLVLFILLLGINCFSFCHMLPAVTSKRLSINGTSFVSQELTAYIAIIAVQLVTLIIIAIPAISILSIYGISIGSNMVLPLCTSIFIYILLSSAFTFFVSRLTVHSISRVMISFIFTIVMCFICGCFIPLAMLPDIFQTISQFLPAHYMIDVATSFMSGHIPYAALLICLGYTVIFVSLGCVSSYTHLRRELR